MKPASPIECFCVALKLGCTSFGGPVAHLGYFHEEYVVRRQWLTEERYAEILAVCQFLPGPASSQLGAAIAYERAGWLGGFASWLGFTLPSVILMIAFAMGLSSASHLTDAGWVHGLKLAAIACVSLAVVDMRKKLCPKFIHMVLALSAMLLLYLLPMTWMQPVVIVIGAIMGMVLFNKESSADSKSDRKKTAWGKISLAGVALIACLAAPAVLPGKDGEVLGGILQAGSLVFGGGHVVLPMLESAAVESAAMPLDQFLAGYGAAQALPGPLFAFPSFIGASIPLYSNPILGGVLATLAIFLPGMIILSAGLPLWDRIKLYPRAAGAVQGANATVVGLLGFALLGMFLAGSVRGLFDLFVLVGLFFVLRLKLVPVWATVLLAAVIGQFAM